MPKPFDPGDRIDEVRGDNGGDDDNKLRLAIGDTVRVFDAYSDQKLYSHDDGLNEICEDVLFGKMDADSGGELTSCTLKNKSRC
jgi:hypothetical protein